MSSCLPKTQFANLMTIMAWLWMLSVPSWAQDLVVPGMGIVIDEVGDDFEDQGWLFIPNLPKSSRNIDKKERGPLARSKNGRWLEGPHRGTPDVMERVRTPPGGLYGSRYSLLMQSKQVGIPKRPTGKPQQDDIMVKVRRILGDPLPPSVGPSCVVRVYVPPFEKWENRSGASLGIRMDTWGKKGKGKLEQYWPGLFINFRSQTSRNSRDDSAFLAIRADANGKDVRGPEITPGWWTFGMSVGANGQCQFYAREGVGDLTEDDFLAEYYCYGYRCQRMDLMFFNVVAFDNGKTWSTPWVIDDPTIYCRRELAAARNRRQY